MYKKCTNCILYNQKKRTYSQPLKAEFFFIKDKVDDGEIRIVDCHTKSMWAEVLTKPLQGGAFKSMRAQLMNCSVDYEKSKEGEISSDISSLTGSVAASFQTPQECVENNRKLGRATDR
jgi:hypothetical protein